MQKESESESEVAQSCPTLCNPMYCSLPGSSVHGILQAIVLEWIAISFSRGSSQPRTRTWVSHIVDFTHIVALPPEPLGIEHQFSSVAQLCLTLCDPMDCSLPGSSIRGIFKAGVLEWVAISFSRGSFQPWDQI